MPALSRDRSLPSAAEKSIAWWLIGLCAMVFLMVVIGGVTRLTESGLSITEWNPVIGIVPPLGEAQWLAEFDKYKQIPQYAALNQGMSLGDFKSIFFWEYLHRLWGRLIGIVYLVPFLWFLVRGRIPRRLAPALAVIFLLGGMQGVLGWYMVKSGLVDRIEVSQYRLVAHLVAAVLLYLAMLWVALGLLWPKPLDGARRGLRRAASAVLVLVLLTLVAGGFVAGLRAGYIYNTFPTMNGDWVPEGYARLQPWILNWFETIPAVQFNHRVLAETTFGLVAVLWFQNLKSTLSRRARLAFHGLFAAACLQVALGISTLLLVVPIPLAAAHQAGAILLVTAALVARHAVRAG